VIRDALPQDTPTLLQLAEGTGVFRPLEIEALREVLDDYHATNVEHGHRCVTWNEDSRLVGFAYFAPAAMTDRGWYLYWIAVAKDRQGGGIGRSLLAYAEAEIQQRRGRLLLVETSSLPSYEPTRRFYERLGYHRAAVLEDYYRDGDSMIVYRKRLGS
jgi:ribosomal protein S18 acetylase RimI-like enzyme